MCGINGVISLTNHSIDEGNSLIEKMNQRLAHRGPDANGVWHNSGKTVFFGQTRLSIIDLSDAANQPMTDDAGNCITFNGEIYNFQRLKKQHLAGENFRTSSDTEVLLKMYAKYGQKMLEYIEGMFAFAIWDNEREEVFLARDRVGKKPFYYTKQNGKLYFASEVKSLLATGEIPAELDNEALYHFLTYNVLPAPLTMFKNIEKLDAGYSLSVTKAQYSEPKKYWGISYSDLSRKSESDLADLVYDQLEHSVKDRLVSDVPIGAFLSGGVDSSAVVALMRKFSSEEIKTYSIGFEDQPGYDELKYAKGISDTYGTSHFEKTVTKQDLIDFLPTVVEIFDEPLSDTTAIPIYFLAQLAAENNTKVVMTGDGADEIFAGYRNFMAYAKRYPKYKALLATPKVLRKTLAAAYGAYDTSSPVYEILKRAANNQELAWIGARGFKESVKGKILSRNFKEKAARFNSYQVVEQYQKEFEALNVNGKRDSIDWMCYMGFRFADTNRYLFRSDRLGMAHSIEERSPFMDSHLVNLALSLPSSSKIKNGEPKYILKKALERLLSNDVLYRKKQGFNVPIKEWAGDILTDYVLDNAQGFCKSTGLFNAQELENQASKLKSGNVNYTNSVWTMYFLMNWMEKWKPSFG